MEEILTELALYRKWRSRNFDELVGQPHITKTLHNAVQSGKISHAYLFCGPRGTGKTSAAKIFAKALNCEKGPTPSPCGQCSICLAIQNGTILDCIEIDAASNRGIDEIRDLREKIKFPPTFCRYKVYIIDEVHMLTPEAFNALLKTLEEPPPQTIFILCTTEPHKLLPTVTSRCQRFDFRRISTAVIQKRLEEVAQSENMQIEAGILPMVARAAEGSLRDALSLLDQLRTFCQDKIEKEQALLLLGQTPRETLSMMISCLAEKNLRKILTELHQFLNKGGDLQQLMRDMVNESRRLLLWKIAPDVVEATEEEKEFLKGTAPRFQSDELYRILRFLTELRNELRYSQSPQLSAEIAFMRIVNVQWEPTLEGLKRRMEILEEKMSNPLPPVGDVPFGDLPPRGDLSKQKEILPAVSLEEIQGKWPELIESLQARRDSLFGRIQEAKPVKLEGKILTLSVPDAAYKNRLEQKREDVQKLLKEFFQCSFLIMGEVQPADPRALVQEAEKIFEGTLITGDLDV